MSAKVYNKQILLYAFFANYGIHFLIVVLLTYLLWFPISHYRHLLSWHAILGVTAFVLLMSESNMLLFYNSWYIQISRKNKALIHGILFGIATVFAILACYFEYYRKATIKGHHHFDSLTGVTALLATIIAVVACLAGLIAANCDWFREHILNIKPVILKAIHSIIGQTAYTLGMHSLCCAYYSNWFVPRTQFGELWVLVFITSFITSFIVSHAITSLYWQINSLKATDSQRIQLTDPQDSCETCVKI